MQHVQHARSSLAAFRGDWSEAALAFRELIRVDRAWVHGGLGDVLFKLGDTDGAIEDWTYVLEFRPTSSEVPRAEKSCSALPISVTSPQSATRPSPARDRLPGLMDRSTGE